MSVSETKGRVTGLGAFGFKCKDEAGIAKWYVTMFGVQLTPETYEEAPWRTAAGTTVFQPFPMDTGYFRGSTVGWMINFRVDYLDAVVERLRAADHAVEYEGDDKPCSPNGRFAKLHDLEGNAIQLWQPGGCRSGVGVRAEALLWLTRI